MAHLKQTLEKLDHALARLLDLQCALYGTSDGGRVSPESQRGSSLGKKSRPELVRFHELGDKFPDLHAVDARRLEWRRWSTPAPLVQRAIAEIIAASTLATEAVAMTDSDDKISVEATNKKANPHQSTKQRGTALRSTNKNNLPGITMSRSRHRMEISKSEETNETGEARDFENKENNRIYESRFDLKNAKLESIGEKENSKLCSEAIVPACELKAMMTEPRSSASRVENPSPRIISLRPEEQATHRHRQFVVDRRRKAAEAGKFGNSSPRFTHFKLEEAHLRYRQFGSVPSSSRLDRRKPAENLTSLGVENPSPKTTHCRLQSEETLHFHSHSKAALDRRRDSESPYCQIDRKISPPAEEAKMPPSPSATSCAALVKEEEEEADPAAAMTMPESLQSFSATVEEIKSGRKSWRSFSQHKSTGKTVVMFPNPAFDQSDLSLKLCTKASASRSSSILNRSSSTSYTPSSNSSKVQNRDKLVRLSPCRSTRSPVKTTPAFQSTAKPKFFLPGASLSPRRRASSSPKKQSWLCRRFSFSHPASPTVIRKLPQSQVGDSSPTPLLVRASSTNCRTLPKSTPTSTKTILQQKQRGSTMKSAVCYASRTG